MRVLIIEDDTKLGGVIKQGLKEHGFVADLAADGRVGLELATTYEYDAVLLDVMLPGKNGIDVLRELRKKGSHVPVMMLTARSSVGDRVQGLDLGADDYLSKPFDFAELLARLRAITRRPPVEPRTVLRVADLSLDLSSQEVKRGTKKIDLTAKEYALLEFLIRRYGLVVTRTMILNYVWDMDYDGGSNIVEVYINYLRKKIDQDFEPKLIHTLRGTGYTLREPE